jgi:matrixin
MTKRYTLLVSCFLVLILVTTAASAYVLLSPARRWFNANTPRLVHVDADGMASVTTPDHGVAKAMAAVTAWNSSGVNVTASTSNQVSYTLGDGISDIIFSDPRHICTGTCLAATTTGYYDTGSTGTCGGLSVVEVTDADVAFNTSYDYTTTDEGGCTNEIYLEAVVSHEVGHVIGLAHSNVSSALMYPSVAYCDNKQIASDDINGRNALYNCTLNEGGGCTLGGPGASCTTNGDCCSNSCKGKPGNKTCK